MWLLFHDCNTPFQISGGNKKAWANPVPTRSIIATGNHCVLKQFRIANGLPATSYSLLSHLRLVTHYCCDEAQFIFRRSRFSRVSFSHVCVQHRWFSPLLYSSLKGFFGALNKPQLRHVILTTKIPSLCPLALMSVACMVVLWDWLLHDVKG